MSLCFCSLRAEEPLVLALCALLAILESLAPLLPWRSRAANVLSIVCKSVPGSFFLWVALEQCCMPKQPYVTNSGLCATINHTQPNMSPPYCNQTTVASFPWHRQFMRVVAIIPFELIPAENQRGSQPHDVKWPVMPTCWEQPSAFQQHSGFCSKMGPASSGRISPATAPLYQTAPPHFMHLWTACTHVHTQDVHVYSVNDICPGNPGPKGPTHAVC